MPRVCEFCGKGTSFGHHIRHQVKTSIWKRKAQKKNRRFLANLQQVKLPIAGFQIRARVCTRCMRTLMKSER